ARRKRGRAVRAKSRAARARIRGARAARDLRVGGKPLSVPLRSWSPCHRPAEKRCELSWLGLAAGGEAAAAVGLALRRGPATRAVGLLGRRRRGRRGLRLAPQGEAAAAVGLALRRQKARLPVRLQRGLRFAAQGDAGATMRLAFLGEGATHPVGLRLR